MKMKEVKPVVSTKPNEIYGKQDIYDRNMKPLTNIEMYTELNKLHDDIKNKTLEIKSSG